MPTAMILAGTGQTTMSPTHIALKKIPKNTTKKDGLEEFAQSGQSTSRHMKTVSTTIEGR